MHVLVTGIAGQDGSYLAEQLADENVRLTGVLHPREPVPAYLAALGKRSCCELTTCDLADPTSFRHLLRDKHPDCVFHLGAISQPRACELNPDLSKRVNVTTVEVLVEWLHRDQPAGRILTISSAAVFGSPLEVPQNENTHANPVNEYGKQKQVVRELAREARQAGYYASCAIAFNHESPRRPEDFVFSKVCNSAARIALGKQEHLELGDVAPQRDWGYAPEYVTGFRWMLEVEKPLELVLATGEAHSVKELVDAAFSRVGLDPKQYVTIKTEAYNDKGPRQSVGDASRAWVELGWEAQTKFNELIELMTDAAMVVQGS